MLGDDRRHPAGKRRAPRSPRYFQGQKRVGTAPNGSDPWNGPGRSRPFGELYLNRHAQRNSPAKPPPRGLGSPPYRGSQRSSWAKDVRNSHKTAHLESKPDCPDDGSSVRDRHWSPNRFSGHSPGRCSCAWCNKSRIFQHARPHSRFRAAGPPVRPPGQDL